MKTMTCRQLGGPCDVEHHGEDHNEVIQAQDRHLKAQVAAGDETHREAHEAMKGRWKRPISGLGWYRDVKRDFAGLPDDTQAPLVVRDADADPEFARGVAVATGFTPDALAVAPLHVGGGVAGVLSVLDAAPRGRIETLGVIVALAGHAAAGLRLAGDLDGIRPG